MAKKKEQPSGDRQRKRYLTDEQCQAAAARIKGEASQYEAARVKWEKLNHQTQIFPFAFVPIWPADPEGLRVRVERLYHPAEAAVILAALV